MSSKKSEKPKVCDTRNGCSLPTIVPKTREDEKPGAIYVGHIPHGFYEQEMRKYFSQFGTVTSVYMARSAKVPYSVWLC